MIDPANNEWQECARCTCLVMVNAARLNFEGDWICGDEYWAECIHDFFAMKGSV